MPLLPQDTLRRGEDETAGEYTATWSKPSLCRMNQSHPGGVYPHSLPGILLGDISRGMRFVTPQRGQEASGKNTYWMPARFPESRFIPQHHQFPLPCTISKLVAWGMMWDVGLTPALAPSPPPVLLLGLFWSKSQGGSHTRQAACLSLRPTSSSQGGSPSNSPC